MPFTLEFQQFVVLEVNIFYKALTVQMSEEQE